jgi:hypothetical protein
MFEPAARFGANLCLPRLKWARSRLAPPLQHEQAPPYSDGQRKLLGYDPVPLDS